MRELIQELAAVFKDVGFLRKAASWYLSSREAIVVVNLQRSQWAEHYYMNIGIWLLGLEKKEFPRYNHCHFYARVEGLFPQRLEVVRQGLSVAEGEEEGLLRFLDFVKEELIPFLRVCLDEQHLRRMLAEGLLEAGLLTVSARDYLGKANPDRPHPS